MHNGISLCWTLLMALCLSVSLSLPLPARAAATNNCSSGDLPSTAMLNSQLTENTAVGSLIPGSDARLTANISCTSAWSNNRQDCVGGGGWALFPMSGVIPTLVPGYSDVYTYAGMPPSIGYQFLDATGQALPLDSSGRHDSGVPIQTGQQSVPIHFRAIKVSNDLQSGSFDMQFQLGCNSNEWANRNDAGSTLTLGLNAEVITQTCSLQEPDVQVRLPQIARGAFKGVGDSAGSTPFNLDFKCDESADARFNISDITSLTNATDIMTLIPGSTASGLGVRLQQGGNPVRLAPGQAFDAGGSEFPLRNLGSGKNLIRLPFSAEYVQTEESLTPGTVMVQGMVTIDYN
ncbi:fimbrial protein [Aeromonas intestinalis]